MTVFEKTDRFLRNLYETAFYFAVMAVKENFRNYVGRAGTVGAPKPSVVILGNGPSLAEDLPRLIARGEHTAKDVMDGMKNISKAEVLTLRDQVAYQSGQVVSRTLAQNEHVSVTLFSFDKGEEISTHESGGDAMVTCLDGVGRITIDGVEHILHEGESIVMPARHPHAVYGQEQFKMLLVLVF